MSLTIFLQQCLTGISLGGVYALTVIGYTLVYGILRLINFTHDDILVIAEYSMIFTMASLPWFITTFVTLIVTILLGVTIERVAYRPLCFTPGISVIVSVIGASYLLQNLTTYLLTVLPEGYPEIPLLKKIYRVGGLSTSFATFLVPALTLVPVYSLILLANHAKIGVAMRAISGDYEIASLMGTKVNKTITFTFAAGFLLAGIGSILYLMNRMTVFPFSGILPDLRCFVATAFGGIGSIPGAVIGGLIPGLEETVLIAMGRSTSSDALTFILLIVMLLIRPIGPFDEKTTDKV